MGRALIHAHVIVLGVAFGSNALAQSSVSAGEALFQEGVKLLKDGKLKEACDKFARSQEVDPSTGTLMNLAECHARDGKAATAWGEFSKAASAAANSGQKERERSARARCSELEKQLYKIRIRAKSPSPAQAVKLDGLSVSEEVGFPVDPGEHTVVAEAPGRARWSKTLTTGPGPGTLTIDVPDLEPSRSEPSNSARVTAHRGPSETPGSIVSKSGESVLGWSLLIGGGASLLTGGVFWGLTASKESDRAARTREPDYLGPNDARAVDLRDSALTLQTVSIVTTAVGVVAAGLGITLIATNHASASAGSARIVPTISPNFAGLSAFTNF